MKVVAALATSAALLSAGAAASAQKAPAASPPAAKTSEQAAKDRTAEAIRQAKAKGSRKGVLRFEGEVVEGKAAKPEAFYLLQRTTLSLEGLQLKTDLVPKLVRSLKKAPF